MGMLMHHTWLEQQKRAAEQPVEEKAEKAEETNVESAEPVKKAGGRRKATK